MKPYYDEAGIQIYLGDSREVLPELTQQAQTCVTSPPYFGLREARNPREIGAELTPDSYVDALVQVFEPLRKVLKTDGVLWLNLDDSSAGSMGGSFKSDAAWNAFQERARSSGYTPGVRARTPYQRTRMDVPECKPTDLIGVPWMAAFALRGLGYYLRSEVIWEKPDVLPESIKTRPTRSHETMFLLSNGRYYYYDPTAVQERSIHNDTGRRLLRSVWSIAKENRAEHGSTFPPQLAARCVLLTSRPDEVVIDPFMGSGTTLRVAKHLGRQAIGIEIEERYCAIAAKSLAQGVLL